MLRGQADKFSSNESHDGVHYIIMPWKVRVVVVVVLIEVRKEVADDGSYYVHTHRNGGGRVENNYY